MSIKVCNVTSLHEYDDGRIFQRVCKSLKKKYEVFFVVPNTQSLEVDGVHIIGVALPDINHRLKRWTSLNKLLPILIDIDADIYHFHDPELMPLGLKMKKYGKKIVFDSHEDVPAYLSTVSYIPRIIRGVFPKIYALYEKRLLSKYDALVSVTPFIVNRLKKINPNTYQITNYPSFKGIDVERKWERKVIFAGLIGEAWNLDKVIRCLPRINTKLILCGHYATDDYLKYLMSLPEWEYVEYRGRVPHSQVLEFYGECCAGLAIESYDDPNIGYREGSLGNTKRLDYMSAGIPVITSASKVWGDVVDTYKCGLCVQDPKSEEEIADVILSLVDNKEYAKELGDNAKEAVRVEYNWDTQEKVLFDMYNKLLGV